MEGGAVSILERLAPYNEEWVPCPHCGGTGESDGGDCSLCGGCGCVSPDELGRYMNECFE